MKRLLSLLLCIIIILGITSCGKKSDDSYLSLCDVKSPFQTLNEYQKGYMEDENYNNISAYDMAGVKNDSPNLLKLSWKWNGEEKPEEYFVYLSTNKDMTNSVHYWTKACRISVGEFLLDQTYYWYVEANVGDKTYKSEIKSFDIADAPIRLIYVDGVENFRDFGHYKTTDGKQIKQGYLYRGARLDNEDSPATMHVTSTGLATLKHLGIKSELDLRSGTTQTKSFIENCKFYNTVISGTTIEKNFDVFEDIFEILSDKDNFPVYIHCRAGADRTGLACYVINAVLGVSQEDLCRDYMMTNFAFTSERTIEAIAPDYIDYINAQPGETLKDKAEYVLVNDCGVPLENIEKFREIVLE